MSFKERVITRLTDAYNKNSNSNIAKVIGILVSEFDVLNNVFEKIDSWRSIENAKGKMLDDFGNDISQYRGQAPDEIYRVMLRTKIASDLSKGDRNTIIEVISMALNTDKKNIGIEELWENDNDPASINIADVPIEALNKAGMTGGQFVEIVQAVVAAGIKVKEISLEGTFEYANGNEPEEDENKGYSNDEQEIGGYYGDVFDPADDYDLMI